MTRRSALALGALALSLASIACEEGNWKPNFGAYAIDYGECEGSAYDKDMDTGSTEPTEVWAEADGRDVLLHLDNLNVNCCPSPDAAVTHDGTDILVEFEDVTSDTACDCTCVMDFTITIEDLDAGTYSIEVDHNGSDLDTVEVVVE